MVKARDKEIIRLEGERLSVNSKLGRYNSQNKSEFWELINQLVALEIEMESYCNE